MLLIWILSNRKFIYEEEERHLFGHKHEQKHKIQKINTILENFTKRNA